MSDPGDFFIGWAARSPQADRRFLLAASIGLLAASAAAGAAFALRQPAPGPGGWDQGAVTAHAGVLIEAPYPMLLAGAADGVARPMLLVGYGKDALPRRGGGPVAIEIAASEIRRGALAMLAIRDVEAFIRAPRTPVAMPPADVVDAGPFRAVGEIIDAKCWFGAMNPGVGLTHKACAALCARGGLPLAFCPAAACGEGDELMLLLDEHGQPHGRALARHIAKPVIAEGRLVRRNGMLEVRVPFGGFEPA